MSFSVANMPMEIIIGRTRENGVKEIRFDLSPWLKKWPGMTATLIAKSPDDTMYVASTTMDGSELVWNITSADTATDGVGMIEIEGMVDDKRKVSSSSATRVLPRMDGTIGDPPEYKPSLLDEVEKASKEAQQSARNAAGYAEEALNASKDAEESKNKAQTAAVNAKVSEKKSEEAAQAATTAAQAAGEAKTNATSAAETATAAAQTANAAAQAAGEAKTASMSAAGTANDAAKAATSAAQAAGEAKTASMSAAGTANDAAQAAGEAKNAATSAAETATAAAQAANEAREAIQGDLDSIRADIDSFKAQEPVFYTEQNPTEAQKTQARANISAADADDVKQLRDDVDGMFSLVSVSEGTGTLSADDFTWGFINGSTGAVAAQKNRAVTTDFLPDGLVRVECASPYKMRVSAWEKESGAFVGNWTGSGWGNTSANHDAFAAFAADYKYKICVLNPSNDVEFTDFSGAAASITLFFSFFDGTAGDVVDALRRKTVSGTGLTISDAIAGVPMRCVCDSPITLAGLNLSPVGEVSLSVFKQVTFKTPLPAGTYTLSARCESTDTDSEKAMLRVGNKYIRFVHDDTRYSASFTLTEEAASMYFYAGEGATPSAGDTAFWREVMIVAGSEDKPYEPPVETVTCDAGALTLMAQTNVITADTPVEITYIQRNDFVDSLLSATKSAELNAQTLGYVTPEMFGAAADGVTDDAEAVQACIDMAAELGYPAKCMRSYSTGAAIRIGSNMDVEINSLKYTGTDCAVLMNGASSRVRINRLESGGSGLVLRAEEVNIVQNAVVLGDVICAAHGILMEVAEGSTRAMSQNRFDFRLIQAGGDGCYCIATGHKAVSTFITENTFFGGNCKNADWAYYGAGGNNKFYNIQVEGNIKGGFLFYGSADALVIGDRHAESMRDGEYPYIKIVNQDGVGTAKAQAFTSLRYISPIGIRVNEIDLSEVAPYETNDSGAHYSLQSNGSLGVIDCRIVPYINTGEGNALVVQHFADRALIWGNCLIFQGVPEKYWQVTESLDLRTITEDTPAMPTVFDISCANAEIRLHPTYCFMGIGRFEVIQTAEYTATIYDYFTGSVIFDGTNLGEGTFEVRTYLSGDFARLNGEGMIWKVRKIS